MGLYENNPCYGCEDRAVGCHGKCEKHSVWIAELREKQDAIYKRHNQTIKLDRFMKDGIVKRKRQKRKEI